MCTIRVIKVTLNQLETAGCLDLLQRNSEEEK